MVIIVVSMVNISKMGSVMNSWYKIYSIFICLNFSCIKIEKLFYILCNVIIVIFGYVLRCIGNIR